MAGRGPVPSEDPVRRNAPVYEKMQLEWDGFERGPELPTVMIDGTFGETYEMVWTQQTRDWWANLRKSPQAMVMHHSDWDSMLQTAMLHNRFWAGGLKSTESTNLAAEIRRRLADYGATYADRQRLRMVIKTEEDEADADVRIEKAAAGAVDYATRLAEAAAKQLGAKDVSNEDASGLH